MYDGTFYFSLRYLVNNPRVAAICESMLPILFDKNWNMVKVGCRGVKVVSPQILLSAHTIPFRLVVR